MDFKLKFFISEHGLSYDDFYDARGRSVNHVKQEMYNQDKLFAYNTTPCNAEGHTVRARSGHCIICNTAYIEFQTRSKKRGIIYVAGSRLKEVMKVGMTTEPIDVRISKMNSRNVGGTSDWVPLITLSNKRTLVIENTLHKELEAYRAVGMYSDNESKEIYRCSYQKVVDTIDRLNNERELDLNIRRLNQEKIYFYNFKNLRKA